MRIVLTLFAAAALFAQSSAQYRITHTYVVGGDGSWDYIVPDPPNHRLFIGRQNRVMVVDEDNGKLLGEVTGIQGAHGTAIAPATGHGFATSGNDQSVVMFDLKTFKALGRIPAAEDADAIIYDARRIASSRSTATRIRQPSSIRKPARASRTFRSAASRNTACRPATARSTRTSRTRARSSRSTPEDSDGRAALVHRPVQAAGRDGDRHGASPVVQRVSQRRDGDFRLPGRQRSSPRFRSARASTAPDSTPRRVTRLRRTPTARLR